MSRTGKRPIAIPSGTTVTVTDGMIAVKGKGGELTRTLHPSVSVAVEGSEVSVAPGKETRLARALWGTYAAHVRNMIAGVNKPFEKKLQVEGIGYRAEITGKQLKLMVGFSHPIMVDLPEGVAVAIDKNIITVSGPDKERVGQFAAVVREVKKPEPYKGKGIRYAGEVVRQKQGKKSAT